MREMDATRLGLCGVGNIPDKPHPLGREFQTPLRFSTVGCLSARVVRGPRVYRVGGLLSPS